MTPPDMPGWDAELQARLDEIRAQGLFRELRRIDSAQGSRTRIAGRELLNFSSNDYLGLANHPRLKEAAIQAVKEFGCGSGASRLICGSLAPHHELEQSLAAFKGLEAALSFSSGCAAAMGTICALMGRDDVVVLDKLVHASIIDAARLSGAKLRIFAHNDLNELEDILKWAVERSVAPLPRRQRILIATESVFSMDGDYAPLPEIVRLKEQHGAWLMVDEAHATGLFGKARRGLAEEMQVGDRIEIQMGTLGKALGSSGGFIAGSRALVELLVNRARSFIFSTAPVPAAAAAAREGVELVRSADGLARRNDLWRLVDEVRPLLSNAGWPMSGDRSAIIPLIIGAESDAVSAATALREQGIYIPGVRYPTVARGQARLRLTLTANHTAADFKILLNALNGLLHKSTS